MIAHHLPTLHDARIDKVTTFKWPKAVYNKKKIKKIYSTTTKCESSLVFFLQIAIINFSDILLQTKCVAPSARMIYPTQSGLVN